MGLISTLGKIVGGGNGDAVSTAPRPSSEFMRNMRSSSLAGWTPALRDSQDDISQSWELAAARATDMVHNSGWISGMFDQAAANTVGTGLRLRAQPENDLFGMSEKDAQDWRNNVERRFNLWASNPVDCDIEGRRTFWQMQDAAFRTWLTTGEVLSEIVWRKRFGSKHGTKVRLLSPSQISNRDDVLKNIKSGVMMNSDGFPIAYLAKKKDQYLGEREFTVRARDKYGRPRVVHVFTGMPGQVRGISPLVPAMKVAKQFDQLSDATLLASLIQTVFAANIVSDAPTEEMLEGLMSAKELAKLDAQGVSKFDAWYDMQAGWQDANDIDVGIAGRVTHTFPGQKLEFLSPNQPQSDYKEFSLHLMRELARCLGMSYESATGDYSGAGYTSVRMSGSEIFKITMARRKNIITPFCQPVYEAWLEEEIQNGDVTFPGGIMGFMANRTAACSASWLGDPKTQADDLKGAKAHQVYRDMGVITDEQIANDLGLDIEDVYAQRARELELRKSYNLPEPEAKGVIQEGNVDNDGINPDKDQSDGTSKSEGDDE